MQRRFWLAVAALGAALALLVPSVAPLSGSMDAFAADLANGTFRPFGPPGGDAGGLRGFSSTLGGLTGSSLGNFLPGASDLPDEWLMDRDGRAGAVTVDHVFNPSLGAMKRLKAYDRVDEGGTILEVADTRLGRVTEDRFLAYDTVFTGRFDVHLRAGEAVPIFSPHPRAVIESARLEARIPGSFSILKDGADTFYALSDHEGIVTLNITYRADSAYYFFDAPGNFRVSDYPAALRPTLPPALREDAQVILARAGVTDPTNVGETLLALAEYFRAFEEGDIPPPTEVESLYLALGAGGKGCCRHRAFAFMVTAHAVEIPTRVIVNEAHAFVEVMLPNGRYHQINLGGCGTYRSNNPEGYPSLFQQANDPRAEANPDEGRPVLLLPSITDITESPARIQKGERYFVNGTVTGLDGEPVPNARIDVFLNETKEAPGRLTGAGTTGPDGRYSVEARVPKDLPARSYQLVARATEGRSGDVRYEESWSDPPVDVFAPTAFLVEPARAAVGVPVQLAARLVDVDSNAVAGVRVAWDGGASSGTATTDARGRFVFETTFDQTGETAVSLRFEGDDHHGAASARLLVDVQPAAILLSAEPPILTRAQGGFVTGTLAATGASVADELIEIALGGFRSEGAALVSGRTDAQGRFSIAVTPDPDTAPGTYSVSITAREHDLTAVGPIRVAAMPVILLFAPPTASADETWVVEATLRSDDGRALTESLVELTFAGEGDPATFKLLTNRTGVARFHLPENALAPGTHVATLRFPGDADHVAAEEEFEVQVLAPVTLDVPVRLVATLVGLVLLGGVVAWAVSETGPGRRMLKRAAALAIVPERRRLGVSFADHPEGVPPAYEPGSVASVRVSATDLDGANVRMLAHVTLGRTSRGARTGGAPVELALGEAQGVMRLSVRARGLARLWTRPIERTVLVSSYRHAVEQGFIEMRKEAALDASATAGDLVRALDERLDPMEREALLAAASLFDVADYSEAPIDRAAYHEFARARLAVMRALGRREETAHVA